MENELLAERSEAENFGFLLIFLFLLQSNLLQHIYDQSFCSGFLMGPNA
jgi:hypothetical protein